MPRPLPWSPDQDTRLTTLLSQHGATLRKAAKMMGVSRSFAQRRAKFLLAQSVRSICTREREDAGAAPLPAGHPISWMAIAGAGPAGLADGGSLLI